ncbi:MAG: YraN family protein [Lachnospiraceae bacterium]|nr:YraN family protein [Lachnospiraceae bacterium]
MIREYNKRQLGARVERLVEAYLVDHGFEVLEMNYRCRQGEIDIIAREGDYYVFVEVKYRNSGKYGSPAEAVGASKQKRICRAAQYYLYHQGLGEFTPVRFDVASVLGEEITYLRNAFDFG